MAGSMGAWAPLRFDLPANQVSDAEHATALAEDRAELDHYVP
jgi:hypothetical protein